MLFSSMEFIFIFLPVVVGTNLLLRDKVRNYWLLLSSLVFYAWGEPSFVFVMIGSIGINYIMALFIERCSKHTGWKKILLVIDIACNLSVLFIFKYLNFVTRTVRTWLPGSVPIIPATSIALPIGISFFTFQALSYVIDVYRGTAAQKNPAYLGLYISLFPQLIAGPIVRYGTIAEQINNRKITMISFSEGVLTFLRGFNKKILLANVLSELADTAFGASDISIGMSWLGALSYMLQIYFDFCGYSDMAIGLGKMLGFRFEKNFDYPYISRTITEFWRRWHISLGSWFRDYVYFPMGGSRVKSKAKLIRNLFVVWLLTGIWHGAEWTFILWGVLYGILITLEKVGDIPKRLAESGHILNKSLYQVFTLLVILLGWVLFRSENITQARIYLETMFGLNHRQFMDDTLLFYLRDYLTVLFVSILSATPFFTWLKEKLVNRSEGVRAAVAEAIAWTVQLAFFLSSVGALLMGAHNPFIYFNF